MPTYEYICKDCGHEMEAFQNISAKPLTDCPSCHEKALKRKISAGAGIIFKGNGFYQTDYRSSDYQKAKEKDKPAAAEPKKTEASTPPAKAVAGDKG